jgi:ACS family hexuronate transporter-like MFS transporter
MTLPTDLFPKRAVGTVAGLVGLGGAMGGVVLGQLAGYLLDHGFSYAPVLVIAGSLHIIAFIILLLVVRLHQPLPFDSRSAV